MVLSLAAAVLLAGAQSIKLLLLLRSAAALAFDCLALL
jgi:hypothetical protein